MWYAIDRRECGEAFCRLWFAVLVVRDSPSIKCWTRKCGDGEVFGVWGRFSDWVEGKSFLINKLFNEKVERN